MWKRDLRTILTLLLVMLLLAVLYGVLSGCTRTAQKLTVTHDTVYVEHHTTDTFTVHETLSDSLLTAKIDTFIQTNIVRDSVFVRDSIYVKEKGDSVYIYKEKWRTKVDLRHDTVYKAKTDTFYQTKNDTIVIYRFIERGDSAYNSKTDSQTIVKERRTLGWLKVGAAIAVIFGIFALWLKIRK